MNDAALRVAWVSYYPLEWMPDLPEPLRGAPRQHPASWQRVLLGELARNKSVSLTVYDVGWQFPRSLAFESNGVRFECVKVPARSRLISHYWIETILLRRRLRILQPHLVHGWGIERGAALVASRLRSPHLVTMHGLPSWIGQYVRRTLYEVLEAGLERPSLRRARVVTAESSFAFRWLRDHYPHLEVHQVEHAPLPLFHAIERRPELRPPRFLYLGQCSRLKGTDLLIQALANLHRESDFRLVVAGIQDSQLLSDLRQQFPEPRFWERVTFRQNLTASEVAEELSRAAMLLFPTRVDNSPNAVKEAAVGGVPVVASSVGGIPDHIFHGLNGLTFPGGDLEAFIGAIRTALSHPLFSRGLVDVSALAQVRARLDPERMANEFLRVYRRVLAV